MAPPLVILAAGLARRYGGCKPLAPIGPRGEAVLDLLASDALASGFGRIVLVLHPETGPAIRYHVDRCWPAAVEVAYAEQDRPLGTVHAVLAAERLVDRDRAFAVCNADDVYGEVAMGILSEQLASGAAEHALVGYRLRATVATGDPVTRGVCTVGPEGLLESLVERRQVTRIGEGTAFVAEDGLEPKDLSGDEPTSVNLWGFQPPIWDVLHAAFDAAGLDEDVLDTAGGAAVGAPRREVLLPEVVAATVRDRAGPAVRVRTTDATLIGVTHAADLPVVSAELSRQVAWGIRPATLWGR